MAAARAVEKHLGFGLAEGVMVRERVPFDDVGAEAVEHRKETVRIGDPRVCDDLSSFEVGGTARGARLGFDDRNDRHFAQHL